MNTNRFLSSACKCGKKCLYLLFFVATLTALSSAQLTYTTTKSYGGGCSSSFLPAPNVSTYSSWVYKDSSGVSHDFSGSDYVEFEEGKFVVGPGGQEYKVYCGVNITTSLDTLSNDLEYYLQASGASGTTDPAAVAYPKYQVVSIVYAAPGNVSSNGFTNSTTDGTTTSITQSFTSGSTSTFTTGFSLFGIGASSSWSLGDSQTTGNTSAFTETITDASGVSNASGDTSNQINHGNDLFLIWVNPAIEIVSTGSKTWLYSVGTELQGSGDPKPGTPEVQYVVEVFASAMEANSSGVTTVPLEALEQQTIDSQTVPGLAAICANKTYYPNSCSTSPNQQCGCVPSDFSTILAQDPVLNYSSTESPLNADASGATACASPTTSDSCRYVPVPSAPGSSEQETELLSGPDEAGGNRPINSFTQTDADTTTQTLTGTDSYTVGYGWGISAFGSGLSSTTQFTWTNSESTGKIDGTSNSMAVSLSSTTVDCYQEIPIFEDTVYHTFVFQQPAGNTSCP
jgi:hypothetical protein